MKNLFLFIILIASSFSYSSSLCENAMTADKSVLSELEEILKNGDIGVSVETVKALANMGEPARTLLESKGVSVLKEAMDSKDVNVRVEAVRALVKMGEPTRDLLQSKGIPVLKEIMKKYMNLDYYILDVRIIIIKLSAKIGEIALPVLEEALKDENWEIRVEAVRALAKIGEPALPLLEKALKDDTMLVRVEAVRALVKIGEPARSLLHSKGMSVLKKTVKENMNSGYSSILIEIVRLSAKIGEPALPVLEETLRDEHWKVRLESVKALVKMGEPARSLLQSKGLSVLEEVKEEYKALFPSERLEIIQLSVKIGEPALSLVKDEALTDKDAELRQEALRALVKIKMGNKKIGIEKNSQKF